MNPLIQVARRIRSLFRRRALEAEMAEEMRFHLEQRSADYVAEGMPESEARRAAERKFGNLGSLQEQARDTFGWSWLERILKDLRLAARQLLRSPGFTLLAVVTLGLGIGASTSMFSVLNGILLKPLPFADLDRLERFFRVTAQNRGGHFSAADFLDLQRARDGYYEVAAYTAANASLSEPGQPAEFAFVCRSTLNLLSLLGVQPQLGRGFRSGEDLPGHDRVVILSQRTWRDRFGGRPEIIGHSVRIDGEPREVIGVMPASFNDWRYFGNVDVFCPLALSPTEAADRRTTFLRILARRDVDRSRAEASGYVGSFGRRLAAEYPEANAESSWRTAVLQEIAAGDDANLILPMLIALSGFVLLIACSNLANLLLARTMARAREFAVRGALGASRTQLLRPLIAESLLMALAGGALAIVVALWFRDWAAARSTGDNGEQVRLLLDWRVATWNSCIALVTSVAFGLAPTLFALRLDLNDTLKSGGRGMAGGPGHKRFRQFLIIGQFALAMVLLAGAALFIRGLHELNNRRSGWESTHLVTGSILLPSAKYADPEKIAAFHRLALERLAALPGVASASISSFTPFFTWPDARKFVVEGREQPQPGHEPAALVNGVSPGYFVTVGTRVLAGRAFTARDDAAAERVFIINQAMARGLFGTDDPIGRRLGLKQGDDVMWGEIVGVVSDVQSINPEPSPVVFQIYLPMAQEPRPQNEIAVRTAGVAAPTLVDGIRTTLAGLDPDLPVRSLLHADARIERANYQLGVLRDILAAIAVLGLGLASLGIYGVIARTMAQRTGEFAIRLALGAASADITGIVLVTGVKLALAGSALGLIGALGVSRLLVAGYPGIHMSRPGILAGTTLLLIGVALLACWLPARRAGKVDAMTLLRAE